MATPSQAKIAPGNPGHLMASSISLENYAYLQDRIYAESGIVLEADKHYLLESRLMPIVRKEHYSSLDELCSNIRSHSAPELLKQVVEAMTTNETLFFRDASPFEAMRTQIIPQLKEERAQSRKLRFWSAAASSGQEAYSLAMALLEMDLGSWDIEILGTDLSEQILDRARAAKYMQIEVNRGLPAPYLVKYFRREGLEWQLKDEVRRMVRFQQLDLRQNLSSLGVFDIVLCRNVLIYFDVPTKKSILAQIRKVLHSGGYLVLGGAETTINLDDTFQRTPIGQAILYRLP
jgi:chemotaxis protein methyltransferase CheR